MQEVIDNSPSHIKPKLEGLQFKIDGIRRVSKTPLDALLKLHDMMKESLGELKTVLNQLLGREPYPENSKDITKADVLDFKPKNLEDENE